MSELSTTLEEASRVMQHAYSPYSKFNVGACIRTKDGSLFSGCNIENSSYSVTLCAESGAISSMISSGTFSKGTNDIEEIAVVSSGDTFCTPCGACLQRLTEFARPTVPVYMEDNNGNITTMQLGELFPQPFNLENVRGQ